MPEVRYNVEIKFKGKDKYNYLHQHWTLAWAIQAANRVDRTDKHVRIRRVIKTVVWKNGKLNKTEKPYANPAE